MTQPSEPGAPAQPPGWSTRWRRLRRLGPWYAVALVACLGIAVCSLGQVRAGGYLLAAALAAAGLVRALVPQRRVGGLAVRRPWIDVFSWWGLAAAVVVAFTLVRL